ncbi:MAG: N-acetylmuramoyl-L-alanine amidase [Candidatus Sabulitectum sp.]|nr:N-acetylmuramoyl-L-alanine amidase [Candidatus Sabulitectum sp.]
MTLSIALCPGHHKQAKGAVNKKYGLNEHDEAIKVVSHLNELLTAAGCSVSVFTGKLGQKIRKINEGSFHLALDIHFNAGGGKGCEVIYVPHSAQRKEQASVISEEIALHMSLRDRGPKEGWYQGGEFPGTKPDAFVAQTNCCAFIPEPGFLDDNSFCEYWLVAGRHEQIAQAIAHGIIEAFGG